MRIAIVNDMAVAVEVLKRAVLDSGRHSIAWVARGGLDAIEKCHEDRPDLILMDMVMPGMNGAVTTRHIMNECPCAILIVTASMKTNAGLVYEAIGAGALDAVRTPSLVGLHQRSTTELLHHKIEAIERLLANPEAEQAPLSLPRAEPVSPSPYGEVPMVGIGASAGGPAALAELLSRLPADFPAGVVVVQHLDYQFMAGLIDWLNDQTPLYVRAIEVGDRPAAGEVLIAYTGQHVIQGRDGTFRFTDEPKRAVHRPSIDVFFKSVARKPPADSTFILMTGMQRDGAEGLLALRQAGCHTIAQDQESSAVFGMPKAAAQLGAARKIMSLDEMPRYLLMRYPRVTS
jgi:chemotaxis response regulator CheB